MERSLKQFLSVLAGLCVSNTSFAAYVESAIGNAVVNDASAVYYNPAALTLVPNMQFVGAEVISQVFIRFNGTTIQRSTLFTQRGSTISRTYYFLPYTYLAIPINKCITVGVGGLYNFYGIGDYEPESILRYNQTYSYVSSYDVTPGIGIKLTDKISVGAGLDFVFMKLTLNSMAGSPPLRVADTKIINNAHGRGRGVHVGILARPAKGTFIGLSYNSAVDFHNHGRSIFDSSPKVISPNFKLRVVTPPKVLLSVDQFVNKQLGFLGTIERIAWRSVRNLNLRNVAFRSRGRPVILPSANQPYFLYDTWRFAVTAHYSATPKLTLRGGVSYDQSPENPRFLVAAGNNTVIGLNAGYAFTKQATLDFTYTRVFYKTKRIHINGSSNLVHGLTKGGRNVISIKGTWNMV